MNLWSSRVEQTGSAELRAVRIMVMKEGTGPGACQRIERNPAGLPIIRVTE